MPRTCRQAEELAAGYWTFPAELRQRLDRWTELDELETDAAERQLDLMGSVLAR
jgi:hypothetical protein